MVYLRAVLPDDYSLLRLLETSSELAPTSQFRGSTPSPERWVDALWAGILAQFIVVDRELDRPIGLVSLTQPSFQDGHARLRAAKFDGGRHAPLLWVGLALFLDYSFACWDLRKVYVEIAEYNYAAVASAEGRLFEVEARLRDHFFVGGEFWDQLILAVYRETWVQRAQRGNRSGDAQLDRHSEDETWARFVGYIADLAHVSAEMVTEETRVVEDLGLDSLALAELVSYVIDEWGAGDRAREIGELRWDGLTARSLFDRNANP